MSSALEEIQTLAKSYDQKLREEFGDEAFPTGGTLFLGKHYATSDKIFLGLNPGSHLAEDRKKFELELREENGPWGQPSSKFRYWQNCTFFFGSRHRLASWIEDATSTFLIPWASCSLSELRKRGKVAERIEEYSGVLVRKMIEHHQAKTLIVVGVNTLRILASLSFLDFRLDDHTVDHFPGTDYVPRGYYQWRKVVYQELNIYQVPHFSRANNRKAIIHCASWLEEDILSRSHVT